MIFSEDSRIKIPCILHLVRLGYRYLSLNREWDSIPEIPRRSVGSPQSYEEIAALQRTYCLMIMS